MNATGTKQSCQESETLRFLAAFHQPCGESIAMSTPPCVLLAMASARKLLCVGTLSCFILGFVGCSKQSNNIVVSKAATEPTALTNSSKIGDSESTDSPTKSSHQGVTFYSVDHYDASRNPATDLSDTIRRATKGRKRILIQVGGDWCSPCRLLSALMETNGVIRDTVTNSFVVMKVAVTDEQGNEAFLSQYPQIDAYPHILVLDSDGRFLHSQGTFQWDDEPGPDELDARKGYNQEAFRQFLVAWQPEPAETVADSESNSTAQPPQTPDRTGPSTAVSEGKVISNAQPPAQDVTALSALDIVKDGDALHRSGKPVTARIVVASVKALTSWDDKGNERQVLQLKPEIPADQDSPNEFSIHFSADVRATFKRIGIDDVTKHFAGKMVEVHGPVAAIRYESQLLRKITWAYHIEVRSLDQILRVETISQNEKPNAVNLAP